MSTFRIGVVSPVLDGYYFGNLLYGIHLEAKKCNAKIVAIQTFPDMIDPTEYRMLLAKDQVDGWIVILNAVTSRFFEVLNEAQKPFVCIGRKSDAPQGTFISSEGYYGIKEMTQHLLGHGYRRIAFMGMITQYDIIQRHQGYLDALREHGDSSIVPHLIPIPDNIQQGGRAGAALVMESGLKYDAVVAATDLNAVGLMEELAQHGYKVPDDIAVTGFDDINIAVMTQPPLTTIRQDIETIGTMSVRVLVEKLLGRDDHEQRVVVDTRFVLRASCGCEFHREEQVPSEQEKPSRDFLQEISTNLYEVGIRVRNSLVSVTADQEQSLSWLASTHYHSGCLALWNDRKPGCRELTVKEIFGEGVPPSLVGQTIPVEQFPTDALADLCRSDADIVTLHLMQTTERHIGVLALVGPMDHTRITFGYDYIRTCFSLLAATMERKMLSDELKRSEAKYRDYFNHTPVMIVVTDADSVIMDANPFFLEQMGYEHEETAARPLTDFLTESSREHFQKSVMQELPYNDYVDNLELQFKRSDGQIIDGLVNSRLIDGTDRLRSHLYVTIRNITQRKRYEEQIKSYAFTDALTGLANRLRMDTFLQEAIQRARAEKSMIAVMFIDLDKFKQVNDQHGHEVGDLLLKHIGTVLLEAVGEDDLAARLGGDEFILAFGSVADRGDVERKFEHVLNLLSHVVAIKGEELEIPVQASIGVSVFPEDGGTVDELLKKADFAMYRTKLNRRGHDS